MNKLFAAILLLPILGCDPAIKPEDIKRQNEQEVVVIARQGDVTVYKVKDVTPCGASWIYFSSTGHVAIP